MGKDEAKQNTQQEYTGEGFIPINHLIECTSLLQQRQKLCEEVDYIESKEGDSWLFSGLKTNILRGIDKKSLPDRIRAYGSNQVAKKASSTFFELLVEAMKDLTLIILTVAALGSIVIHMIVEKEHRSTAWIEGFAILLAVVACSSVQALNNYQKEKQFQKLSDEAEAKKLITIIRDGVSEDMRLTDCVVGDLVVVKGGDEIAADGILVESYTVGCDESAMTGETEVMEKATISECLRKRDEVRKEGRANTAGVHEVPSPVMMSGTMIQQGRGKMIITCVGVNSAIGRIKKTIGDNSSEETPLQKKLVKIAEDIGKLGLVCAVITFIVMLVRLLVDYARDKVWGSTEWGLLVQAFLIAITVLVVAIPEGLPLAVTLSLAYSVKKMLKDNNLVRKMHACETMGGADVICSDKTGTLTENKMYLTHFWNFQENLVRTPFMHFETFVQPEVRDVFSLVMTCNSLDDPKSTTGNPTDMAILKYMLTCGIDSTELRAKNKVEHLEPFTSDRKRMSTALKSTHEKGIILLHKGASEIVTAACSHILDLKTGQVVEIDEHIREKLDRAIVGMARQALRTIGLAYKYVEYVDKKTKNSKGVLKDEEDGFILVGIAGIQDVIRNQVPESVAICNRAGITVKMVTGDNKITARAIARICNIISKDEPDDEENGRVMEGPDFYKLIGGLNKVEGKKGEPPVETIINGAVFDKIYKNLAVLARSRPEDKYAMVAGLRERGHVVAVTGDGTNDAPALSKANVGFAMGITGTQVAKQAASIMLMDDNFTSIVQAVKWGRNIYDSIRKFLQFQLTVNVVAVVITFISAAVTQEAVLSSVQMLWINMIMDTLASLALATEPPTDELLDRKPSRADDYIVNKKMAKHIFGAAVFQIAVMMLFLFEGPSFLVDEISGDSDVRIKEDVRFIRPGLNKIGTDRWDQPNDKKPSRHFTYNFNVFVMMTIFNFLNARKLNDEFNIFKGVFSSLYFPVIVCIIFVLQFIILTFGSFAFRIAFWVLLHLLRVLVLLDGLLV